MITLGRFHYPAPVIVLAPMAGISDRPFRELCQHYGADYTVAEMISAKPDLMDTDLSRTRLQFSDDDRYPKIIQLVGGDAALMAEAARMMQARGADVLDINMGCPSKKVGKYSAGSALMGDPQRVAAILSATVHAVDIPVTLKTRLGTDDSNRNIREIAHIAEDSGISLLTVHGRTRAQRFKGEATYEDIAEVKATCNLPVIVNGDITSAAQAKTLIDCYGFDGVMIGRGAQGNPWLFAECQHTINARPIVSDIDISADIYRHIDGLHNLYGEHGTLIARKHLHWYAQALPNYRALRDDINQARNRSQQLSLIQSMTTANMARIAS